MKAEEKLKLISRIIGCYYECIERGSEYKDGIIDAIENIVHFMEYEDEGK